MNRFEGRRWANVYPAGPTHPWKIPALTAVVGQCHRERQDADISAMDDRLGRVSIKLKPEGAPNRYASEANRRAWELHPDISRWCVAEGCPPEVCFA